MQQQATTVRSFSLTELLGSVRRCLEHSFPDRYWVRAEVSDLRRAGGQGHGYLELLEKGEEGEVVAKVRATIWSSTYTLIEQRFERSGVGKLTSGMSILALAGIAFHPQYGLSLNSIDIDPNYSLGEIARLRLETIQRLKRNGLFTMNKELDLPSPLQRIAIISSPTAAGYGDFMRQLHENPYGVVLYTALFTAQMQGSDTTASILAALGRIAEVEEHFDAVVIIRGGGAVSELRAFDDYTLCEAAAQFPLPIIAGIGHERDVSVLDLIAHTTLKTPTAVATFLVEGLASESCGSSCADFPLCYKPYLWGEVIGSIRRSHACRSWCVAAWSRLSVSFSHSAHRSPSQLVIISSGLSIVLSWHSAAFRQ